MKLLKLSIIFALAIALTGCENPELNQCQQDKQQLQAELDNALKARQELQTENEKLEKKLAEQKEDSKAMQTKAMESITKMLTKQSERESQIKKSLKDAQMQLELTTNKMKEFAEENAELKMRIAELEKTIEKAHKPEQEPEHTE
jgi:chromosome segregation ATPase